MILLALIVLAPGCSSRSLRSGDSMVILCFNAWGAYPVVAGWETAYVRKGLEDAKALGVTHILVTEQNESLLFFHEIKRAGLKAVIGFSPLSARNGAWTGSQQWRLPIYIEGLRAWGVLEGVDGVYFDDHWNDLQGDLHFLRGRIKTLLPGVKIIASPTSGATFRYANTLRAPFPDILLLYGYVGFSADAEGRRKSHERMREEFMKVIEEAKRIRRDKGIRAGIWLQTFGYWGDEDPLPGRGDEKNIHTYHYWLKPGELAWQLRQMKEAGLTDCIAIFDAVSWASEGDKWGSLWDQRDIHRTHSFRKSRREPWWSELQKALERYAP
jgi:hypothetical protein